MSNTTSLMKSMMGQFDGSIENARKDALRKDIGTHIIDTCFAIDTGEWETGIEPEGKSWVIVEQYGTSKENATIGHNKWVDLLTKNPKTKLKEVLEPGL